jgi:hypothetical protein
MTANSGFKQVVRARMAKTGESYTTARAQLMRTQASGLRPEPVDFDRLSGMKSTTIEAKTGCGWEKWVYVLDKAKAYEWPHARIAEHINAKYQTGDWWTQMVTTGYERIKGLRAIGQRRGGNFEASRSKTFPVAVSKLYSAWSSARTRKAWLDAEGYTVKLGTKNRSMSITWGDGTRVTLWFQAPAKNKSQVAVTHMNVTSKAEAQARKAFWGAQLESLERYLRT